MQLVELSEDPRAIRRDRIAQIQWERQDPRLAIEDGQAGYEGAVYEREVIYEDWARRGPRF